MLPATFFQNNRRELIKRLPREALVVITASGLLQQSGDTTYPFRQDSNFWYLTGIDEPEVLLVMASDEEFLVLPKRSDAETIFGGAINCDDIAKISNIMTIYSHAEGWERYKKLQKSRKKIYTLSAPPAKVTHTDSFFTNPARRRLLQTIKRHTSSLEIIDIRSHFVTMRQVKQPEEIVAIEKAVATTRQGFIVAKSLLASGATEYELAAEFTKIFMTRQSEHAYQPIIAGGVRACTLHYIQNNQPLKTGELCLIDVGAQHSYYAADVTRTYVAGTEKTSRQQEVYDAVSRVQQAAIELLKDGRKWRDYMIRVDEVMGTELIKLGLIKHATREEVRRYFSHGISHSLGLDVHDICDYNTLHENMVITVEPGIYIPEEGIGVRIEDDVLIAKDGAINLSSTIPY